LITWGNAIIYAEALNFAGFTDWRMPNVKELLSLSLYAGVAPLIYAVFTNTKTSYEYWTSTTNPLIVLNAYRVSFSVGAVSNTAKTNTQYLRCVRLGL